MYQVVSGTFMAVNVPALALTLVASSWLKMSQLNFKNIIPPQNCLCQAVLIKLMILKLLHFILLLPVRNALMLLCLVLMTGYSVLAFSPAQQGVSLELYGTFQAMGITVSIDNTADPNNNAVATVTYRKGSEPYRAGLPLTRVNSTRFVGSLFWLEPGTSYDVKVSFSDPNGAPLDGLSLQATASTRTEIRIPSAINSYIVSSGGNGATCSLVSPCSLSTGISRAQPGDEVVLRGGIYYQGRISLPRSGAPGAPIVIRNYNNEVAVLDGADPAPLSWTAVGAGVYYKSTNIQDIRLVIANGVRLYPYNDLASLQNLSWNLPGFYTDGTGLYVHLAGNANPNNALMVVSRYNRGFDIDKNYIYFLNLTFRHYGQGSEARGIYFTDASNNLVHNSIFALNNGGMSIRGESHGNVIQDSEFSDTLFNWPWDAVKAADGLERGGVYFGGPTSGRGNVIRRNIFHGFFDGLDVCPSEPSNPTDETDVYGNLVYNAGDDGVQVDGWCSNVRLWNNTFHDVLTGISFAPTAGGPTYAIRNLIYRFGVGNTEHTGDSFKFNSSSSEISGPIYLLHNTAVAVMPDSSGLELSSGSSAGWALVYTRNNIWVGLNYALRNKDINYPVDFDYDNLWNGTAGDLVRWGEPKYATLAAFTAATGQEPHGLNVNPGFANPQNGGYLLNPMSSLIDAGVIIPGINHNYVGLAPDVGAFETRWVYLPLVFKP